ncbi:MAG TPA: NAD-dependent epimerase/dehydratase family protein [Candidatus Nanopelagicales bacterium]|nr:NAD-dependent epimerase/dehydratase family protein [Candidatus Nanopelagicales bacterium]
MQILVLGGTRFVGRHVVEVALGRGHQVTLLHRGGKEEPFPEAEHVHADRDAGFDALAGREFDATIDVSAYFPRQVQQVADALGPAAGRYLVISSTSVYAEPAGPGFDETSPTVPAASYDVDEITDTTYGQLKVAIEEAARDRFGDRATVVRPTYVIGPWDYTDRFTYWVRRIAEGGEVLAPGDPDDPIQVIDARDMARWIVGLVEDDVSGTFHAVSPEPPFSFRDMLESIAAEVAPAGTALTWVDQRWLLDQGEDGGSIPLWGEDDPWIAANAASAAAARATGLAPRPLSRSVREILEHVAGFPAPDSPAVSRERERELLDAWHAR